MRKQKGEQLKMEMRHETEIQEIKTVAHVALDELKSLQVLATLVVPKVSLLILYHRWHDCYFHVCVWYESAGHPNIDVAYDFCYSG